MIEHLQPSEVAEFVREQLQERDNIILLLQGRNDCQTRTIIQLTTAHCEGSEEDKEAASLFRECIWKLSNHEVRMLWGYLHACVLNHVDDPGVSNLIEEEAKAGNELAVEMSTVRTKVCNYQRPDMRDW